MTISRTHTNTYVIMEISPAAYDEIRRIMKLAGREDAFDIGDGDDEEVIDMHGIALKRGEEVVVRKEVIKLEPGDLLVLTCQDRLSERTIRWLREGVERIFPGDGMKAIVLDGGMELDVLRKGPASEQAMPLSPEEYAQMQRLAPRPGNTAVTTMDQKLHDALYERFRKYGRA